MGVNSDVVRCFVACGKMMYMADLNLFSLSKPNDLEFP
jgi:hypothetical protein